jgi:hypothetical protein
MAKPKAAKKTVKVLGYTVTVGSKKHLALMAQIKHFKDLEKGETGVGRSNPALIVIRKNGKRVKTNTSIKMTLRDLRRLVSGARAGKTVRLKARGR